MAASNVQSSFSLNQNDVFPLCGYVAKTLLWSKKPETTFTASSQECVICVPDSNVKYTDSLLYSKHIQMSFDVRCHKQYGSQLSADNSLLEVWDFFFFTDSYQ